MERRSQLVVLAVAALALPLACGGQSIRERRGESGAGGEPGADSPGSSGGTAPRGGTDSPTGGTDSPSLTVDAGPPCLPDGARLVPTEYGWIYATTPCNTVGIQGGWYAFGDQYGDYKPCLDPGMHLPSECALVTLPIPENGTFPNLNGAMHTTGVVEAILPCVGELMTAGCPEHDYAHMWGAGIGLDFNRDDAGRHPWDARKYGVVGIRFTIEGLPFAGLRVEFPMFLTDDEAARASPPLPPGSTTDDGYWGAPYWGAQSGGDGRYPHSPVQEGVNTLYWAEVETPDLRNTTYRFGQDRLLGIRFHVPADGIPQAYDFTISELTFLWK